MKKIICLAITMLSLLGCSSPYSTTGEHQYLQSRNDNKLLVPSPLQNDNISHFYILPQQTQNARVSIVPN